MQVHNGGKADHKTGSQISATGDSTWCPHRERRTAEQATFKATHCAATGKTLFAYQWCVCVSVYVCLKVQGCEGSNWNVSPGLHHKKPSLTPAIWIISQVKLQSLCFCICVPQDTFGHFCGNQCFRASLSLKLSCHFMSNSLPQKTFSKMFLVTYMQFYFPFPVQLQIKSD